MTQKTTYFDADYLTCLATADALLDPSGNFTPNLDRGRLHRSRIIRAKGWKGWLAQVLRRAKTA